MQLHGHMHAGALHTHINYHIICTRRSVCMLSLEIALSLSLSLSFLLSLSPLFFFVPQQQRECPADRAELGRSTWVFLHTMAAYYPEEPTSGQQEEMKKFMTLFSKVYPCEDCAEHMQERCVPTCV